MWKIFRKDLNADIEVDIMKEEGYIPHSATVCDAIIDKWVKDTNSDDELDNVKKTDYYKQNK